MTLYEIDQAIMDLGQIDEETGEFIVDEEALKALQMERDKKVENVLCWVKNLKAENTAIRAEEQNLYQRRKTNENKIESLERYVQYALGGEKFKTARCAVTYRTSTSVVVDEKHLARRWMKVSYAPDKTSIKDWIKSGHKIRGAALETKTSMVIK